MEADILLLATPIWLGHPSSLCQRVLERLNADISETDGEGRQLPYGKVGLAAVVGNEDGAHKVSADVFQGLNDLGFSLPPGAVTYWVGEAQQGTDYQDLDKTPSGRRHHQDACRERLPSGETAPGRALPAQLIGARCRRRSRVLTVDTRSRGREPGCPHAALPRGAGGARRTRRRLPSCEPGGAVRLARAYALSRSGVPVRVPVAGDDAVEQEQDEGAHDRGDPGGEVEESVDGVDAEDHLAEPAAEQTADDADEHGDDDAAGVLALVWRPLAMAPASRPMMIHAMIPMMRLLFLGQRLCQLFVCAEGARTNVTTGNCGKPLEVTSPTSHVAPSYLRAQRPTAHPLGTDSFQVREATRRPPRRRPAWR